MLVLMGLNPKAIMGLTDSQALKSNILFVFVYSAFIPIFFISACKLQVTSYNPPENQSSSLSKLLSVNHLTKPMFGSLRIASQHPRKNQQQKQEREWLTLSFKPENFLPGVVIGFILGLLLDLSQPGKGSLKLKKKNFSEGKPQQRSLVSSNGDEELKMVLVVRRDLKMTTGKIASQCAHAATGMYAELMQSHRSLLRQWEQIGQPKIVVTCKNQQEMNKLKETAEGIGLPTFVVADAGRTQVVSGSKTVLAVGPGPKESVDSVTGKLGLL